MSRLRGLLFAVVSGGLVAALSGCGPTYPKCESDDHCADKGEYCVNGMCSQCRDNSHCEGAGMMCSGGKCMRKPGYCDESVACPGNQKCRDNECGPECLDNSECTTAGTYCSAGSCIQKPECGPNADNPNCPEGHDCVAGTCQVRIAQCNTEPVYFDFDRSNIKPNQRSKLNDVANCLKGDNVAPMEIGGHCDERGTAEYNLALGERRAEAVRRYLNNKGVDGNKLSTRSYGEESPAAQGSNERAWSKNRRAEFMSR